MEKNIFEGAGVTWDVLNEGSQDVAGLLASLSNGFGLQFAGNFSWGDVRVLTQAIGKTARSFGQALGDMGLAATAFKTVFSKGPGTTIRRMNGDGRFGGGVSLWSEIQLWDQNFNSFNSVDRTIHELGHTFNWKVLGFWSPTYAGGYWMLGGLNISLYDSMSGWQGNGPLYGDGVPVVAGERFADMFMGYVTDGFNRATNEGLTRSRFMNSHMRSWLLQLLYQ